MTIFFWLSSSGVEYLWQKWDKKYNHKWEKRHEGMLSPGGIWKKVHAGFYIQDSIDQKEEVILNLVYWLGRKGLENTDIRKLFSKADETGMSEYPGPMLLLAKLGSDFNPEKLWPLNEDEKDTTNKKDIFYIDDDKKILWFWSYLCRTGKAPLPCNFNNKFGWLIEAPDKISAACWELTFLVAHGLRPHICDNCQKGVVIKGKKCSRCKGKRQHSPESRFRNLLAQYVRRGKITRQQRMEIKEVLSKKSLFWAKRELDRFLGKLD